MNQLQDSKFRQILKIDSALIEGGGGKCADTCRHSSTSNLLPAGCYLCMIFVFAEFACLDFPLSDEPNLGTWRIQANLKVN